MKDKMDVAEDKIESIVSKFPLPLPPQSVVKSSNTDKPKSTWTTYRVNLAGEKFYPRPKGKAKKGWEWDSKIGDWIRTMDEEAPMVD